MASCQFHWGDNFNSTKTFSTFLNFKQYLAIHTHTPEMGQNSVGLFLSYKSESFLKLPEQKAYQLGHDWTTNTFTRLSYQLVLHDIMCRQKLICYKYPE